jgi:hypothetical protein
MKEFYVYKHFWEMAGLIYIGSGKSQRPYDFEMRHNSWKKAVTNHGTPEVTVLCICPTKAESIAVEEHLIGFMAKREPARLVNVLQGGRKDQAGLFREWAKKGWNSEEYRKKHQSSMQAWIDRGGLTNEQKKKRAEGNRLYHATAAAKSQVASMSKKGSSSLKRIAILKSEEHRKKIGETAKMNWSNPEYKARMIKKRKKSYTPERSAKSAECMKRKWADPEYRRKVLISRGIVIE